MKVCRARVPSRCCCCCCCCASVSSSLQSDLGGQRGLEGSALRIGLLLLLGLAEALLPLRYAARASLWCTEVAGSNLRLLGDRRACVVGERLFEGLCAARAAAWGASSQRAVGAATAPKQVECHPDVDSHIHEVDTKIRSHEARSLASQVLDDSSPTMLISSYLSATTGSSRCAVTSNASDTSCTTQPQVREHENVLDRKHNRNTQKAHPKHSESTPAVG